jgi:preprotein translocase subunit SecD
VNLARLWAAMVGTVLIATGLLAFNLAAGNEPVLGLDLQGGVSVILAPTEPASSDDLIVIRDLIRDELEQRGIAEPDVRVEGTNIVVDLPGVRDQRDALEAVDVAGIVTLRPVIQCGFAADPGATVPDETVPDETVPDETVPEETEPEVTVSGFRRAAPDETVPAETGPIETGPIGTVPDETGPDDFVPAGQDVLPIRDTGEACLVGPPGGTGEVFARGSAGPTLEPQTGWGVAVDLRREGEPVWNALASQCYQGAPSCPSRQLAIVLDDVIQSAPVVNAPSFAGSVSITGDFSESEARDLARVLNRGAFPVGVEAQSVETVSPALGGDTLRAAVVSGIIGAVLIMLLLALYYRTLAVVAISGLIVWAMAMYSAAVLVSEATNYALSLAGATGIIVAIGIAVDSYVVLFERLKDELRLGRSLRNAAPRSFATSWRTIVSANVVSILAAVILFTLSVGSVKGFALYLGLTTVCNLVVYFLFARPAIVLLTRTRQFRQHSGLGMEVPT